MRVRAITFDYGGTLDGEASHWLDRFVALYAEAGVKLSFEAIKDAFYRTDDVLYADAAVLEMNLFELMDAHVGHQLKDLAISDAELHRFLRDRFLERTTAALAQSRRVLESLAATHRIGVISNFYGNVERILRDAGFGPLLTVVADSQRVGASKPDHRIFEFTLDALAVAAAETLHVGDSYDRDIVAGKAAGMRTAWLVPPATPAEKGGEEDLRIESLAELAGKVR